MRHLFKNKVLIAGVAIAVVGLLGLTRRDWLEWLWRVYTTDSMTQLASYLRSFGIWTPLMSLVLMILQSVIAPLPGSVVAAANGIVFGIWWGTVLSWTGGMLGGTINFWLARWFGQRFVARFFSTDRLAKANELSQRDGFWIVLVARLVPVMSFDFISYLAGLSSISFAQYSLATAIGMIPGSFAWATLGHDVGLAEFSAWRISLVALIFVGGILGGRWWMARHRSRLGVD